jgi:SAM-dependent methyltransferase
VFSDPAAGGSHNELVGYLAQILDPFTTRVLTPLVSETSRCLEIGFGAGSVALWMAERAAEVLATDIEPQHIPAHPRLEVRRHNIVTDPLDGPGFDVIHARLVLAHIEARREVLAKLVEVLNPGGWLVIDEFADRGSDRCVLDTPDPKAQDLFDRYHQALVGVMQARGTDPGWGRDVHRVMRQAGLVEVDAEYGGGRTWHGGQAGALLPYTMTTQIRDQLLHAGMTDTDIARFRHLLLDARLVVHNTIAVSTRGQRPL